jgi:hypothetical protein
MTDNPASSSHPGNQSRMPNEHRPAATLVPADGRRILHDQQRELVRASLIACSPAENVHHHRRA